MKTLLNMALMLAAASVAGADMVPTIDETTGDVSITSDATLEFPSNMDTVSSGRYLATDGSDPEPLPSATFTPSAAYYRDIGLSLTLNAGQSYLLDLRTTQSPSVAGHIVFTAEAGLAAVPARIEVVPEQPPAEGKQPATQPVTEQEAKRVAELVADLDGDDLKAIMSAYNELMEIGQPALAPLIAMARKSQSQTTRVRAVMMVREIAKRSKEDPPATEVDEGFRWTEPANGIAMRVSVDRQSYKPGQLVWLRVDFRNVDEKPRPFAPLTRIDLPKASGGQVEANLKPDRQGGAKPAAKTAEYREHPLLVELKPGQVVTYRFRMNEELGAQHKIMLMHDRDNNQRAGLALPGVTTIDWVFPAGGTPVRFTYLAASRGLLKGVGSDLAATVAVHIAKQTPREPATRPGSAAESNSNGADGSSSDCGSGGSCEPGAQTSSGASGPEMSSGDEKSPDELGRIEWLRDIDAAKAQAAKSGKPVMVLFDEVPGCAGCKKFGTVMLSHPLVVDAAHEAFVPMAVRNNSKGDADAALVKEFGMPTWAYPEIRFLAPADPTPKGELVPRQRDGWRGVLLPGRMVAALEKADRKVPAYLQILADETGPEPLQTTCFWMSCYWVGEAKLSRVQGVRGMRIGMLGKREVVEVDFDPAVIDFADLAKVARESCGPGVGVFARTEQQQVAAKELSMPSRASSDPVDTGKVWQKRALMVQHPELWFLPLTEYQSVRLNALSAGRVSDEELDPLLSPTQKTLRDRLGRLGRGQVLMARLLRDLGGPDRSFAGTIAWQVRVEAYLSGRELEKAD